MRKRSWSKPLTTYRLRKGKVEVVNWMGRITSSIALDKATTVKVSWNNILGYGDLLISRHDQNQKWENISGVLAARDRIQDVIFDIGE